MSIKLKTVIGLITGIIFAFTFLEILKILSLSVTNPIYKVFGIKKTLFIGFQPYWLLDRADKNYNRYITTLSYFGLVIDIDGTIQKLVKPNEEEPGWTGLKSKTLDQRIKELKKSNINLSLLVHNSDEISISALLKNPVKNAKNLIADIKPIMTKYRFTDLNLDIESFQEASPEAQIKFTQFVKEVKKNLKENNLGTLTVDASPSNLFRNYLINMEEIGKIADYIVLMTYDYHYAGSLVSGPVAPLNGAGEVREIDVESNLIQTLKVIPKEKLILGVPLYGYEWETLSDRPGAPVIRGTGATASNRRITKLLKECNNCIKRFDKLSQETSVIYKDEKIDSYHQVFIPDENSMQRKVDLAKKYKIAGIALWALGYEGDTMLDPLKKYK